ncbi:UPF0481 protein At3g47200-like [Carya illinoinensis]|uniref:Uncharacterized protein n=1 Tax=Carya illinoinensis TaxID=32201 RepID=A0A8T1N3B3_CARIL|nr:UPF0481 protein At3g47200-like [Carya illinoinensis]KAG6624625.1 hypothetical protein CIPAW_16G041300 [Carya illinoinensis]
MEIRISHRGESSRPNYQKPIREFTHEDLLNMAIEQVEKYSEEANKLQLEAYLGITRSIYRVLPRLKEINGSSYEPNMVSIGPYYYNLRDEKFKMAEDYKRKCLGSMLVKAKEPHTQHYTYYDCFQRISELEVDIRKCYSEEFEVAGIDFIEMMIVDACFIIEIIDMFGPRKEVDSSESLAALGWMVPYFYRDFLLLENQIPFFVLQEIYQITRDPRVNPDHGIDRRNLIYAALEFFKNGMKRFDLDIFRFTSMNATENDPPFHLLDLVPGSLTPFDKQQGPEFPTETTFIHCVSKLRLAGIKVSPVKADSFLEVKFKKGVIEMPNIAINDLMRCLLLNCVAFEQCHKRCKNYFTVYSTFLDCLVNTSEDIEYLRERNVIDNYLGDDSEAADFINRAGKDLVLNADNGFYLGKLFKDVDKHYQNRWKWKEASFKREYFDKPWLILSAAGGILLVAATSFQAVMAFLSYKYKNC